MSNIKLSPQQQTLLAVAEHEALSREKFGIIVSNGRLRTAASLNRKGIGSISYLHSNLAVYRSPAHN